MVNTTAPSFSPGYAKDVSSDSLKVEHSISSKQSASSEVSQSKQPAADDKWVQLARIAQEIAGSKPSSISPASPIDEAEQIFANQKASLSASLAASLSALSSASSVLRAGLQSQSLHLQQEKKKWEGIRAKYRLLQQDQETKILKDRLNRGKSKPPEGMYL